MKIAQLAPRDGLSSPVTASPDSAATAQDDLARSGHVTEALLRYLKSGRVIRAARSLAPDEIDPEHAPAVPLTAITDGEWIWSGAVVYYAERYGLPVDPGLAEHARRSGYQLSEVTDAARAEAVRVLDGDAATDDRQGAGSDAH